MLELAEAYGYRVLTATSSKRALQLADETNIDLVVSEATRGFAESETPLEELTLAAGRERLLALAAEEEREAA